MEDNSQVNKKAKTGSLKPIIPSSIISLFINQDDLRAGPPLDIPVQTTSKQLEQLVNSLLQNEQQLPYAFYVNDIEVVESLSDTLAELVESGKVQSFEETLNISYQPLSVFRVRPVTRCVETMPGHTDAVIHVLYR